MILIYSIWTSVEEGGKGRRKDENMLPFTRMRIQMSLLSSLFCILIVLFIYIHLVVVSFFRSGPTGQSKMRCAVYYPTVVI